MWAGIFDINYPSLPMRARTAAAAAAAAVLLEQRSTSASWVALSRAHGLPSRRWS